MSDIPVTAANTAAYLVVYSCLRHIAGTAPAKPPAVGVVLTEEQRTQLNLAPGGETMIYDVPDGAVIFDMHGANATVSFAKGDVPKALPMLEKLLKKEYPKFKQLEDVSHPRGGKKRLRVYEGDLGADRHAKIEIDYPDRGAGADDNKFVARISAYRKMRKN